MGGAAIPEPVPRNVHVRCAGRLVVKGGNDVARRVNVVVGYKEVGARERNGSTFDERQHARSSVSTSN